MIITYYPRKMPDKAFVVMFKINSEYYIKESPDLSSIETKIIKMLVRNRVTDKSFCSFIDRLIKNHSSDLKSLEIEDELITMAFL